MEKLYDFKESIVYRFGCDCQTPAHAMDVEIQKDRQNDVIISFYTTADIFRQRLRWCWKMIRTGLGYDNEIVLKEEDVPLLAQILLDCGKEAK